MSQTLLSPAAGRDLIAARAHAVRTPADRALRAYFLLASDARRMQRAGRAAAASAIACTIQAVAFEADGLRLPALARRAFTAVDEIADPTGREALARESAALYPEGGEGQPRAARQGEGPPRPSLETSLPAPPALDGGFVPALVVRLNAADAGSRA